MEVICLDTVNSTNLYAKSNLENLPDKTIIHARRQENGRGRLNRSWIDMGEGNVFMTFVLKPSDDFSETYSNLTQYLSVVMCKILENYGLKPQIKWPNDVLVEDGKVAGILAETVMQGSNFRGLVLGIGVNLSATPSQIETIDKPVTSLNLLLNKNIDRDEFISTLADKFFSDYEEFLNKGFEFIKNDYISRASFIDKEVCVQLLKGRKCGVAKRINDRGELVLADNEEEFVLTIGDIL